MTKNGREETGTLESDTELWTIDECAAWMKFSPEAIRCKLKRGAFPKDTYVYVGRCIRFVVARLKEWVLNNAA
jgi:hypothetical protein